MTGLCGSPLFGGARVNSVRCGRYIVPAILVVVALASGAIPGVQAGGSAAGQTRSSAGSSSHAALVAQYCVGCHNAKLKTANLLLDELDLAHLGDHADIGEKVVRKLRAGMMPPSGRPRPDAATREALITWMENEDRKSVV